MHGSRPSIAPSDGYKALTEKEKQTLRLLLTGHDAKSMAHHLGLSVHTVNERLREARRKLSVGSSREAARLLRDNEATTPENVMDEDFGEAASTSIDQLSGQPDKAPPTSRRAGWAIGGCIMISLFAAAIALQAPDAPRPATASPAMAAAETQVSRTARDWLALVDAGKWNESHAGTAASFRAANTVDAWRAASEQARTPLGRVLSRTLLDEQDIPAPPNGYRTVRFRTDFANKRGATETVSLDREGGEWKVVGIYIQ
jgi:DNA-binding CsgD family transcriptional regulator